MSPSVVWLALTIRDELLSLLKTVFKKVKYNWQNRKDCAEAKKLDNRKEKRNVADIWDSQ